MVRKPEDQKISQVLAENCVTERGYMVLTVKQNYHAVGWAWDIAFGHKPKKTKKLLSRWLRGSPKLPQIILTVTWLYIIIVIYLSNKYIHLKSHTLTSRWCHGTGQGISKVSSFDPLGTLKPTKPQGNSYDSEGILVRTANKLWTNWSLISPCLSHCV